MTRFDPLKDFRDRRRLMKMLFAEARAGIQISGDSGSGKSNTLELLFRALVPTGHPLFLLDPHGDLAEAVRDFILNGSTWWQKRLVYIEHASTKRIVSINPLAVADAETLSPFEFQAKLTSKCEHTARILQTASDEVGEGLAGKPRMRKWISRVTRYVGMAGMALADTKEFLNVHGEFFQALVAAIPDVLAREEFAELGQMRPTDRESIIESTKNRFANLFENPVVEAILGRVGDGVIDVGRLYRSGGIVVVNLAKKGVLRDDDQMILANLWLSEILHLIFNLPKHERRPAFVFLDELPVFHASTPLLAGNTGALTQVRKFLLRFICCHQGALGFPGGVGDPLLNKLVSHCGVRIYLGHVHPVDAEFFAKVVHRYDPLKEKFRLIQQQQYQDGNELVTLVDENEGTSDGDSSGGSTTDATTTTESWNQDESRSTGRSEGETRDDELLRQAVTSARTTAETRRTGRGGSTSSQTSKSSTWSTTQTRSRSTTYKQTLVPILAWRDVVASVEFFTRDEQIALQANRIQGLDKGEAIVHTSGIGAANVQFPLVINPLIRTPKFRAKKLAALQQRLFASAEFASPDEILSLRREILEQLIIELTQLASGTSPLLLSPSQRKAIATDPQNSDVLDIPPHTDEEPTLGI